MALSKRFPIVSAEWAKLRDNLRLALAEWLIWKAQKIAPPHHPESRPIILAAYFVATYDRSSPAPAKDADQ